MISDRRVIGRSVVENNQGGIYSQLLLKSQPFDVWSQSWEMRRREIGDAFLLGNLSMSDKKSSKGLEVWTLDFIGTSSILSSITHICLGRGLKWFGAAALKLICWPTKLKTKMNSKPRFPSRDKFQVPAQALFRMDRAWVDDQEQLVGE